MTQPQPQISDLTAQITTAVAEINSAATTQANNLAAMTANYDTATQELAAANAQIAALTSGAGSGSGPRKCLYGAYPATNNVATLDAKYGLTVPALRWFWPGLLGSTVPATGRFIVGSFKQMPPNTSTLHQLNYWTFQHEIDAKIVKGQYDLASWKTNMTALAQLGIPGLCVIVTANCFVNSSKNPEDTIGWARDTLGVTHFGADFDGISYSDHYHDYSPETAAVHAYATKHNMTWGVPEHGANQAANDPTGVARAAWSAKTVRLNSQAGAQYQLLWEYTGQAGSEYKTPAEIATWTALFSA